MTDARLDTTNAVAPPACSGGGACDASHDEVPAFFGELVERSRAMANGPYFPRAELSADQRVGIDYDSYRAARFRPERSLWRGEPGAFEAQLFPAGWGALQPVDIFIIDAQTTSTSTARSGPPVRLPYSRDYFERADEPSEATNVRPTPRGGGGGTVRGGFVGVRLHAALNTTDYLDEVVVFKGASYFRSLGRDQVYGLSARGLAIDTGSSRAEEFPRFEELYLVHPRPEDAHAWVLALLDSPRVTGAFAFRIMPGTTTRIAVNARIWLRRGGMPGRLRDGRDERGERAERAERAERVVNERGASRGVPGDVDPIDVLGLAPLTSMHLLGEASPSRLGDFRPEIHDSDALVMHARNGEQLVRPLRNPERTTVCTYRLDSPIGFGLVQRDRAFDHYQDLEARYEARPSLWVEPLGDWGPGAVRLLEISTQRETDDNIGAMWVPDSIPDEGLSLRYILHFGALDADPRSASGTARVLDTRIARLGGDRARFVVDFVGGAFAPSALPEVVLDVSRARVVERHVEPNPHTGGVRVSFEITTVGGGSPSPSDVELRAFLRRDGDVLSETWSYAWQPSL